MTETNGVTLREFFEKLLEDHAAAHREHQLAHDREHAASQRAIDTAAQLAKENKADANEWREAMLDRERAFARVDMVEANERRIRSLEGQFVPPVVMEQLRDRVVQLEKVNANMQGALNVARFIGFSGLVVALGAVLLLFLESPL